ncbi:MAG: isocitrate/isopropylmalate dehydrogenase family protein [Clostridia bacterium]|nr:isocitrate/isopropylmalate dehydrogenase family protein [Clostridia bacterium]
MGYMEDIEALIRSQAERVEKLKNAPAPVDFSNLDHIVIGFIDGDGIGPYIMKEARRVIDVLLADEVESGKVEMKTIEGLSLENRIAKNETVPTEVLEQIKQCSVFLKGPTATPDKNSGLPNLTSANVTLRKELDLFANVRPVQVPEEGIDWCFFRENTEGEYAVGSQGVNISDDLSIDFRVITTQGTERIARMAFDYARNNGKERIACITKANIIKKTDGKFQEIVHRIGETEYPEITVEDYYIDIMTANLVNKEIRNRFQVFVLPNLYGDIITDEAAQIQGGMGTAGSANIGSRYAMFEAVHGVAPKMIQEGIADKASPQSLLKAMELMLRHICMQDKADRLKKAMDAADARGDINMSGTAEGSTAREYADAVIEAL